MEESPCIPIACAQKQIAVRGGASRDVMRCLGSATDDVTGTGSDRTNLQRLAQICS